MVEGLCLLLVLFDTAIKLYCHYFLPAVVAVDPSSVSSRSLNDPSPSKMSLQFQHPQISQGLTCRKVTTSNFKRIIILSLFPRVINKVGVTETIIVVLEIP